MPVNNNLQYKIIKLSSDDPEPEAQLRTWYKRVMQVPMIYNNKHNKYLFMDRKNKKIIQSYSRRYKYVYSKKFMKIFYNKEKQ